MVKPKVEMGSWRVAEPGWHWGCEEPRWSWWLRLTKWRQGSGRPQQRQNDEAKCGPRWCQREGKAHKAKGIRSSRSRGAGGPTGNGRDEVKSQGGVNGLEGWGWVSEAETGFSKPEIAVYCNKPEILQCTESERRYLHGPAETRLMTWLPEKEERLDRTFLQAGDEELVGKRELGGTSGDSENEGDGKLHRTSKNGCNLKTSSLPLLKINWWESAPMGGIPISFSMRNLTAIHVLCRFTHVVSLEVLAPGHWLTSVPHWVWGWRCPQWSRKI